MAKYKRMVAGYEIEAHPKRFAFDELAKVTMRKLGSSECGFLTPLEASQLGHYLLEAAKAAGADD